MSKRIKIQNGGMTCTNCASSIKKQLESKGLQGINVNFTTGEVIYTQNPIQNKKQVENIIKKLGYTIKSEGEIKKGMSKLNRYFYISLSFTLPLFSHMFLPKDSLLQNALVQFCLCLGRLSCTCRGSLA